MEGRFRFTPAARAPTDFHRIGVVAVDFLDHPSIVDFLAHGENLFCRGPWRERGESIIYKSSEKIAPRLLWPIFHLLPTLGERRQGGHRSDVLEILRETKASVAIFRTAVFK